MNNCDDIKQVTEKMRLIDNNIGLKSELSTPYKRDQYLKSRFNFIKEERIPLTKKGQKSSFYYYLPIDQSICRLLCDDSLRKYLIKEPIFTAFTKVSM